MTPRLRPVLFAAAALLLGVAPAARAEFLQYSVTLNGPSESPPNSSLGTGTGLVSVDTVANTMRVQVTFSGLTGTTTNSHIHSATATPFSGTAGVATTLPTFAGFPTGVTSGSYDQTFDMTQASSYNPAFVTANGGTTATAQAALFASFKNGTAYLNIHTSVFTGGEIRGFLVAVPEPTSLALLGTGIAGLAIVVRRSKRTSLTVVG